jgi:hypothetical protein
VQRPPGPRTGPVPQVVGEAERIAR